MGFGDLRLMLHYQVSGNPRDPAIVFLHGFLGARADWDEVVTQMEATHYCITLDLPGHGHSVGLDYPDDYGMLSTADAIIEVADDVGLDHFSLAGYSMGGRVALYVATVFAMRLDRLVLESASPGLQSPVDREARRRQDESWAKAFESDDFMSAVESWYGQPIFEQIKKDPIRYDAMLRRRLANTPAEVARSLRAIGAGAQQPLWDDLSRHTMPTLLITGEHDAKFRGIANEMAQQCPAMSHAVVPGSGHNVHFERPLEYTALLQQFIPATWTLTRGL